MEVFGSACKRREARRIHEITQRFPPTNRFWPEGLELKPAIYSMVLHIPRAANAVAFLHLWEQPLAETSRKLEGFSGRLWNLVADSTLH